MPTELKRHEIERWRVDSSSITEMGYQDGWCVLMFTSGHLYAYPMSEEQFTGFAQSESKGKYYAANVKGKLSGEKLTSRCDRCGSEPEIVGEKCSECENTIRPLDTIHKPLDSDIK